MKKTGLVLFIALSSLLSSTAFAGNRSGIITTTSGVGVYVFDSHRRIRTTPIPTTAVAYNFTDNLAAEAQFGTIQPVFRDYVSGNTRLFFGTIDGVYHLTRDPVWQPFAMLGVGATYLSPNGTVSIINPDGDESNTQFNLNGGVGLQAFLSKDFALRLDFKDFYILASSKNDYMFNFGFSYVMDFGHKKPEMDGKFIK